jgi:hypothetical protein
MVNSEETYEEVYGRSYRLRNFVIYLIVPPNERELALKGKKRPK